MTVRFSARLAPADLARLPVEDEIAEADREIRRRCDRRANPDHAYAQGVGEALSVAREHDDHDRGVASARGLTRRARERTHDRFERGVDNHRSW